MASPVLFLAFSSYDAVSGVAHSPESIFDGHFSFVTDTDETVVNTPIRTMPTNFDSFAYKPSKWPKLTSTSWPRPESNEPFDRGARLNGVFCSDVSDGAGGIPRR